MWTEPVKITLAKNNPHYEMERLTLTQPLMWCSTLSSILSHNWSKDKYLIRLVRLESEDVVSENLTGLQQSLRHTTPWSPAPNSKLSYVCRLFTNQLASAKNPPREAKTRRVVGGVKCGTRVHSLFKASAAGVAIPTNGSNPKTDILSR